MNLINQQSGENLSINHIQYTNFQRCISGNRDRYGNREFESEKAKAGVLISDSDPLVLTVLAAKKILAITFDDKGRLIPSQSHFALCTTKTPCIDSLLVAELMEYVN